MLKVDNIIPLWRVVVHNMESHAFNLAMLIKSSSVEQRSCECRMCSEK